LNIYQKNIQILDPKKKEIKKYIENELLFMEDYSDPKCRRISWSRLLNELVLLRKVDNYVINHDSTEIIFNINGFGYYIDLYSEENIMNIHRELVLNDII
jgi:hypothetical protein